LKVQLKQLPANRAIVLKNETCVYCGCLLLKDLLNTKEHVIGKNFVPKGRLQAQWNLIVRACKPCNGRKSDLEDDLGAISMQPDAYGQHAISDPVLRTEAMRRAQGSLSRKTKKCVKNSFENHRVSSKFGEDLAMQMGFTGPPQADRMRVFELARLQITAFFYWLTFDPLRSRGGYWVGTFMPVTYGLRSDWGNATYLGLMTAVRDWEQRLVAITADGFFKVAIRKHPSAICWSWALEWNHNYRIVGFFGDRAAAENVFRTFSAPEMQIMAQGAGGQLRIREELPLNDHRDIMFSSA
jgi:hypothetical protein